MKSWWLRRRLAAARAARLGLGDAFIGFVIGALVVGPLVWTPLGRELMRSAAARAAKEVRARW